MNDENFVSLADLGDAMSEVITKVRDYLNGLLSQIVTKPKYMKMEALHPRKKPRGSMRRARKGERRDI